MCSLPDYLRDRSARGVFSQWLPRPTRKARKAVKRGSRGRPGSRGGPRP